MEVQAWENWEMSMIGVHDVRFPKLYKIKIRYLK